MATATLPSPPASPALLTAEQFAALPDDGRITELVKGVVIEMPPPSFQHGKVCSNVGWEVNSYVRPRRLGHVITNDAGVVTERDPDSVRGADVAYFSFERLSKSATPDPYPEVAPELVFEVRSPSDRTGALMTKVGEYLTGGVKVVCVVDPEKRTVSIHTQDEMARVLTADDELTLPEVFPDFRAPVRAFFE